MGGAGGGFEKRGFQKSSPHGENDIHRNIRILLGIEKFGKHVLVGENMRNKVISIF